MGRRGYPAEFRRRVLDLVNNGRKVADVARDLGVSARTIYNWWRQDRIDCGLEPGTTSAELAELTVAKKRIRELEVEVAIHRRVTEELKEHADPKAGGPGHHTFDARRRRPPAHDRRRCLLGRRPLLLLRRAAVPQDPQHRARRPLRVRRRDPRLRRRARGPGHLGDRRRAAATHRAVLRRGGWAPTVADGGFTHDYSAPSAGPPLWYIYEFTPEHAYAVMAKEPGGATRWTF